MKRLAPLLLLFAACPRLGADATPAKAAPDAGSAFPHAHIDVEAQGGKAFGLQVELALTDAAREQGLMFRKSLADGAGMLFIFPSAEPHSFWMKNTLIPLDMIFADTDGLVLGCVEQAEPMTTSPRTVAGDSKYVLEVPGGWCADHAVGRGAHLIVGEAARFTAE